MKDQLPCIYRVPQSTLERIKSERQVVGYPAQAWWPNGSVLHVAFLGGSPDEHGLVTECASEWDRICGIRFTFVDELSDAEIRIAFGPGSGNWCYIGTECLNVPIDEPTMNIATVDRATVLHQLGHSLGFHHEFPGSEVKWNADAVYRSFASAPQYWDAGLVDLLFFQKDTKPPPDRPFDVDSVMLYEFPTVLTLDGRSVPRNTQLSQGDKHRARTTYPTLEFDDSAVFDEASRLEPTVKFRHHTLHHTFHLTTVGDLLRLGPTRSPADNRYANAWLVDGAPPLLPKKTYVVAFQIGEQREGTMVSERLREEEIDWKDREEVTLEVMLWADGASVKPGRRMLKLPRTGSTPPVKFEFTPDRTGEIQLQFKVFLEQEGSPLLDFRARVEVGSGSSSQPAQWPLQVYLDNGNWDSLDYQPTRPDGKLFIYWSKPESGFVVRASGEPLFPQENEFKGLLKIHKEDLYAAVGELRSVWQESVIQLEGRDNGGKDRFFRDRTDFQDVKDLEPVRKAGADVAKAGHELFEYLFKNQKYGDRGLLNIGKFLESRLQQKDCSLVVVSDDFYVPWSMLYVSPDAKASLGGKSPSFEWNGFLGYRHVIVHKPWTRPFKSSAIQPRNGTLQVGLAVDERIDDYELTPFVKPVIEFFQARAGVEKDLKILQSKGKLEEVIGKDTYPGHILYFACHGEVNSDLNRCIPEESSLTLSDGKAIKRIDLNMWFSQSSLARGPIVFINACQGGQMHSCFYESFANELLKAGARCLIGPQCDLPVVFAKDFAEQFFEEFLKGDQRIGNILRRLTRQFADDHNNPLGLIYSLYYGLDVHLTEPIT